MFYVVVFSIMAVLLVVAVVTLFRRNRTELDAEDARHHGPDTARQHQRRKAQRAQSRRDRRKRH